MRSLLTLLLFFSLLRSVQAAAVPCLVESTNQGGGWFSYSFKRGDADFIWRLSQNGGQVIVIHFPGVLEVELPQGWSNEFGPPNFVYFSVTDGDVFIDEPVTFRLRSMLTETTTYGFTNNPGVIGADLVQLPGRTFLSGGVQRFSYIGPVFPTISATWNGTNIVAQWPTNAVGLKLQENSEITNRVGWSAVTNVPIVVGTNHRVELPASGAFRFFRLTTTNSP